MIVAFGPHSSLHVEPNAYMRRFQAKVRAIFEVEGAMMVDGDHFMGDDSDLERGLLTDGEDSKKGKGKRGYRDTGGGDSDNGSYSAPGLGSLTHV